MSRYAQTLSSASANQTATPETVAAWVGGWAISRGTAAPTLLPFGYHIEVDLPEQQARYILPRFDAPTITTLANSITTPWIFIKVCAEPHQVAALLPGGWTVQAPVFMMTRSLAHEDVEPLNLAPGYTNHCSAHDGLLRVELRTSDGRQLGCKRPGSSLR